MEHSNAKPEQPDLATVKDLANFLRIDRTAVPGIMTTMGVPRRGAGYPWIRIWVVLGIDFETVKDIEELKTPLLELKQVAAKLGESAKTTRRRSEGEHRDKSLPAHIDLGPRKRLFFPAEIESWLLGAQLPFVREQTNLSFIPAQKKKNSVLGKTRNEPQSRKPSPPSGMASMFMAPLKPG